VSAACSGSFNTTQLTHGTNSFIREFDPQEEAFFGCGGCSSLTGSLVRPSYKVPRREFTRVGVGARRDAQTQVREQIPEIYTILENGHEVDINSMGINADTLRALL